MGLKFIQCVFFGFLFILSDLKAQEILVDSSHRFTSENHPSEYPNNYNETWCFVTNDDSRLHLTFDDIGTEPFFDFITVWESTTASADTLLLRWAGILNGEPPRVLSSGNNLCLSLQTDSRGNNNRKGFSGQVDRVSNSFNDDCSGEFDCRNGVCLGRYDLCNGFVNCGNGEDEMVCTRNISVGSEERFTSVNYDDGDYVHNHHFTWYLTSNSDSPLELEFTEIDLEETASDLILVGEGADTSSNLLLTWNGTANASSPVKVRSRKPSMWVQLQSDEHDNGRGFSATVKSVDNSQAVTCNGFDCENGACIPERAATDRIKHCENGNDLTSQMESQLCGSDENLCIDGNCFLEDERCDGEPRCFVTEDDEAGCTINVDVKDRWTRKFRDFSQTIIYTNTIPGTHLLMNLIFLWTRGENVEVNLTVGENDLNSSPLLQKNGILDEYVLTQQFSADVLWLKFSVKGALVISVNAVNEAPTQSSCPDDMVVSDGDGPAEWSSPSCNDREDGELASTCSPSSGDNLPNGKQHLVTCKCIDSLNSSISCNFTVDRQTPEVNIVQVVPLVIGLVVVAILIVLVVSFCVTTRIGRRRRISRRGSDRSEQVPITGGNIEMRDDFVNPQVQPDRQYEDADGNDRQSYGPTYHSISEDSRGSPERPTRAAAEDAGTANPYSRGVYNEDNMQSRPSPPERETQQSPHYSTRMTYE